MGHSLGRWGVHRNRSRWTSSTGSGAKRSGRHHSGPTSQAASCRVRAHWSGLRHSESSALTGRPTTSWTRYGGREGPPRWQGHRHPESSVLAWLSSARLAALAGLSSSWTRLTGQNYVIQSPPRWPGHRHPESAALTGPSSRARRAARTTVILDPVC